MPILQGAASRAFPFIRSGVERGLSGNAIQSELTAAGIGVRRTEVQAAIRGITDAKLAADHLKYIRPDFRPDPLRIPFAKTKILREYSYLAEIKGYNPERGQQETRHYYIASNESMSRNEIESVALGYDADEERYEPLEVDSVNITEAVRKDHGRYD